MQSSQEIKARIRRKRRRKTLTILLAAVGAAAVTAVCVALLLPTIAAQEESASLDLPRQTAQAARGDIERAVYASGSVQPLRQPGVYAKVDATVARALVSMGDTVKAGDVIMELESETLASEAAQLEYDLILAQEDVESVKTYERMRYEQLYDSEGRARMDVDTGEPLKAAYSNELSIRAPSDAKVAAVYVQPGDDALAVYREKGAVIVLSTDGRSKVNAQGLTPGRLALGDTVRIFGEGVDALGTVENLSRRGMDATIVVDGDEYGLDVPVEIYTQEGELLGEGTLGLNKPLMLSAYGGIVRTVNAKVGKTVERDDVLVRFTGMSWPLHIDNASALREYAVAKTSLEDVYDKMDHLTVVAPCDGKVVSVDVEAGADVTSGDKLITLVEDAGMEIVLTVDELDIPLVKKGQRVTMAVDALEGVSVTGVVEKIAPIGNTETSVTTYDVYVTADEVDARVLGGMNVSGEIVVGAAQDALLIPTDAVGKDANGYFVTMEDGKMRAIETGIMTVESTQVLSGLEDGDTILY